MSELPHGWISAEVRSLGRPERPAIKAGPFGSALKKEFYVSAGYRVYGQEQVIADRFDIGDYFIDEERFQRLRSCEVTPGDVLVSLVGTFGKASVVPATVAPGIINPRLIRLSLNAELVDPWFLKRFFASPQVQKQFEAVAHGGTMGVLNAGSLGALKVQLPPLPEQRRIVAKLDALQSKSRRAKDALDAIPPLLERFRQSVLAAAFRGDLTADWRAKNPDVEPASELLKSIRVERRKKWEEGELAKMRAKGKVPGDDRWKGKYEEPEGVDAEGLPELPEGWAWASVDELSTRVTDGTHQSPKFVAAGIPFIVIANVVHGTIDWPSVAKWVTRETYEANTARCRPERGDVLYTAVGSYGVALAVDTDADFMFQRHIAHIKPIQMAVTPAYLAAAMNGPVLRARADAVARGVAQKTVTLGELAKFPVPVAPQGEQRAVLSALASMLGCTTSSLGRLEALGSTLQLLDRAILAKAFRGELVPQDPNDEPATVLLARIVAQRNGVPEAAVNGRNAKERGTPASGGRRAKRATGAAKV